MTLNIKIYTPVDPDLYFDVTDLASPFDVIFPICITNNETIDLYFRAELVNPSADWVTSSVDLGLVSAGGSSCFAATMSRNAPTLTDGEYDEIITLRISAYTDSTYTTLYGYQEIAITIHFIDHTDPSWTILYYDNFDDGTTQGWTGSATQISTICKYGSGWSIATNHYVSPPNALSIEVNVGSTQKSFSIGAYTKAYIIMHLYQDSGGNMQININDKAVLPCGAPTPKGQWFRVVYPLQVNATNTVAIGTTPYYAIFLDEVIVIAK